MAKTAADDLLMIQCEKIVNETWSKAAIHYDVLQQIVDSGGPNTEHEEAIVMIAANATLQKMTLDKALDHQYFDIQEDMALCGQNMKAACPCDREVCLLKT